MMAKQLSPTRPQLREPGPQGGVGEGKPSPGFWGLGISSRNLHALRHKASADLYHLLENNSSHVGLSSTGGSGSGGCGGNGITAGSTNPD